MFTIMNILLKGNHLQCINEYLYHYDNSSLLIRENIDNLAINGIYDWKI